MGDKPHTDGRVDGIMEDITGVIMNPVDKLGHEVALKMLSLLAAGGPVRMANSLPDIKKLLDPSAEPLLPADLDQRILGAGVTHFTKKFLETGNINEPGWTEALVIMQKHLGDIKWCQMPLKLLSVGVRHYLSKDIAPLMELTLEQRRLVEEALAARNDGNIVKDEQ